MPDEADKKAPEPEKAPEPVVEPEPKADSGDERLLAAGFYKGSDGAWRR